MSRPTEEAVHTHLTILEGIIERMAGNSAASKTWCITLVSAILVVVATEGTAKLAVIALLPVALFVLLDSYYLALEKIYRESYGQFVRKVHESSATTNDVYQIADARPGLGRIANAASSLSVWPFYLTLGVAIVLVGSLVI